MSDQKRKPFQFSLGTVLALLLVIAAGLGFWLQQQRLAKARRILAAHGLSLELPDLKPGQVRATVTSRVNSSLYVLLTLLIESHEPATISINTNGSTVLSGDLRTPTSERGWTGEVRILVDDVEGLDSRMVRKWAFSLNAHGKGGAHLFATDEAPVDRKLTQFVKMRAPDSDILELGESIPLIDIGDEQFELEVK